MCGTLLYRLISNGLPFVGPGGRVREVVYVSNLNLMRRGIYIFLSHTKQTEHWNLALVHTNTTDIGLFRYNPPGCISQQRK